MDLNENAQVDYNPDDEQPTETSAIQAAIAEAERTLMNRKGVTGVGKTRTPQGKDAIVVYVTDEKVVSQLPAAIGGYPVIGDVTGEIRAL